MLDESVALAQPTRGAAREHDRFDRSRILPALAIKIGAHAPMIRPPRPDDADPGWLARPWFAL